MAQTLLLNPAPRRRNRARRKNSSGRRASPAQLAWRKKFASMYGGGSRKANPRRRRRVARSRRRSNPIVVTGSRVQNRGPVRSMSARRSGKTIVVHRNPIGRRRRRRNPISLGSLGNPSLYVNMLKNGLIGGGGAIAMDLVWGKINPMLPASLMRTAGDVGVGDLLKAIATVALGKALNGPTRGLSSKMAEGALAVQAHGVLAQVLPLGGMSLGYLVPGRIAAGNGYVGPNRIGRYAAVRTPLLSGTGRYARVRSPLLSGSQQARESVWR